MTGTIPGSRPMHGGSDDDGPGGWRGAIRHSLGPPATGPARWVLALVIFGAVMASSLSLNGVLLDNSWFPHAALVTAFTVLPPALLRRYPRLAPWAPVGAIVGLIMGLTLGFFAGTAYLGVIPSSHSLDAAAALAGDAADTIMVSSTPVPLDTGIIFVICAGLGFVAILLDTLAITVALPAVSGIAIVLVLLPASLTTADGVGATGFAGAAIGYLLILGCCRWYAPDGILRPAANRPPSGTLRRAAALGAAVVLLMTLLPVVIPGFTQGVFPQGSRIGTGGDVSGLDPMISLGNDLRSQSGTVTMTYLTDAGGAQYMRMSTLEDFSGKVWKPSAVPKDLSAALSNLSPDFGPNSAVPHTETTTSVSIVGLSSTWLPTVLSASSVEALRGRWTWDPSNQTINATGNATTVDQNYVLKSDFPVLTPALLEAATQKPGNGLDSIYTKLPNNVPSIISKTAEQVTAGKSTPYDRAMAIQDYLRSGAFTYSVKTPVKEGYDGSGMDVLAKFLEVKAGYCVHFSATMAVFAREVGIPSRIAVGFAPGTATGETGDLDGLTLTGYEAKGSDAHAWPELFFEGLGWVPFEPTPSRGDVPSYAQTAVAPGGGQGNNGQLNGSNSRATGTAAAAPSATATASAAPEKKVEPTAKPARIGTSILAAVLVLLALVAPALTRMAVRRRRLALVRGVSRRKSGAAFDPRDGPAMLAWRELVADAVDYGYRHDPSLTPALQAARMAELLGPDESPELALVRSAYESAVYGPPAADEAAGRDDLADAVERLRARFDSRATAMMRLGAAVLPASLFRTLR
ncbi:transglutaminase TgpA family protein [Arthrobacter sp. ERGS1:01]|uniref:transglutaminase TgpA family protein n=1 Tax=Arthrobacter sp. ERGS1:01 TaxID=1704044 RepID=UPI0006B54E49|nr:DUF3488 and transglutaminase-like domain-containing protein [Arthrobacter sp. ERGS1:01]